ncbi:MAG: PQQ-binding-like beta-propeller repeat protein [Gemmataceae bacterium]
MKPARMWSIAATGFLIFTATSTISAGDWPQWRGPNRDAKVSGFTAPSVWPKALTKKWSVSVGAGVATPALVGDKIYVYTRQGSDDVLRCLDAATGKDIWKETLATDIARTPGGTDFEGPRSSPAVGDGKVVALNARGVLSCYDAASGKLAWRKDDIKGYWPGFFAASSPLIAKGVCIAQVGGKKEGRGATDGALIAYDLATGAEKWKWLGGSPAYASPALMTVGDATLVIAETDSEVVAINAADGKLAWEAPCKTRYNASSPVIDGQVLAYEGGNPGEKAVRIEKKGDKFVAEDLWTNSASTVIYNSPVVANGLLYGLTTGSQFFCVDLKTGKTAWTAPSPGVPAAPPTAAPAGGAEKGGGKGGGKGGPGGKGGGRGGMGGGYGSIVDAGSVLFALTTKSELVAFEPSSKEYKQVGSYKVSDGKTYAYPIVSGNRIYIKDDNSVTLWTLD